MTLTNCFLLGPDLTTLPKHFLFLHSKPDFDLSYSHVFTVNFPGQHSLMLRLSSEKIAPAARFFWQGSDNKSWTRKGRAKCYEGSSFYDRARWSFWFVGALGCHLCRHLLASTSIFFMSERCKSCDDVCLKGGPVSALGAIKTIINNNLNKTANLKLKLYAWIVWNPLVCWIRLALCRYFFFF